mgnify:CR=1 FL=1
MSTFLCPLCSGPLETQGHSLRCPMGHCFDLAADGYVNLLPVDQKHSLQPGDDRQMVAGRAAFLSKGYYSPLQQALAQLCIEYSGPTPVLLDSGCGEGYYTQGIYKALYRNGKNASVLGIDISKFAVKRAARRLPHGEFAVASAYHMPLPDCCADLLLNCFSPLALEEFFRVLRPGGLFLYVVPAARHLWELKQVLYDVPYPNEEKLTPYPGFCYQEVRSVEGRLSLTDPQDIQALFQMTPYAWKTPRAGRERLMKLQRLDTEIAFHIHVFTKQ